MVLEGIRRRAKGMTEEEWLAHKQREAENRKKLQEYEDNQVLAMRKAKIREKMQEKLGREHTETTIVKGKRGTKKVVHKYRSSKSGRRKGGAKGLVKFGLDMLTPIQQTPDSRSRSPRTEKRPPDFFGIFNDPQRDRRKRKR